MSTLSENHRGSSLSENHRGSALSENNRGSALSENNRGSTSKISSSTQCGHENTHYKWSSWFFLVYAVIFIVVILILAFVVFEDSFASTYADKNKFILALRSYLIDKPTQKQEVQTSVTQEQKKIAIPMYVINLKRSTDRWETIMNEITLIDSQNLVKRIEAVDGMFITDTKRDDKGDTKFINDIGNSNKQELACVLSHLKTIRSAWENSDPHVLVLEDDAMFGLYPLWKKSIPDVIQEMHEFDPKWEILQLFSNSMNYVESASSTLHFFPTNNQSGTVAYIISRTGMDTMMKTLFNSELNSFVLQSNKMQEFPNVIADDLIYKVCKRSYCYYRCYFYTNDVDSTIHVTSQRKISAKGFSSKILTSYL